MCACVCTAAIYANDYGCSLHQLGLQESITEAKGWVYGDDYVVSDRPLSSVIDLLSQGIEVSRWKRRGRVEGEMVAVFPMHTLSHYDVFL